MGVPACRQVCHSIAANAGKPEVAMINPFAREPDSANPFAHGKPAGGLPPRPVPRPTTGPELLQRQASAIQEIADRTPTAPATGTDGSESVTMTVGPDGFPDSLRVVPDWERTLGAERLALAITEAGRAARSRQMAATADALQRFTEHGQAGSANANPYNQGTAPRPYGQPHGQYAGGSMSLDDLAEKALKLFSEVERFRPVPAQAMGRGATGRLAVTVSTEGFVSCSVDPQWASGKPSATLIDTFREAVREARQALASQQPTASPMDALKSLFDESLAMLQDPRRLR